MTTAGHSLRFGILGEVHAATGDQVLNIRSIRKRLILAILLRSPGDIVPADQMIDSLWSGNPPESAPEYLRTLLYKLRKDLGEHHGIEHHAGGYRIGLSAGQLDADQFNHLAGQGDEATDRGDISAAVLSYHDSLAIWRGPAFGTLSDHPALREYGVRLEERRLAVLESRIDADLIRGRHHELVNELADLVDVHPFREALRDQLMTALAACGRRDEALEVFRQGEQRLDEELGITPGAALRRRYQAILNDEPQLDPSARVKPPIMVAASPQSPPVPRELPADVVVFTDRTDEVGELSGALTGTQAARVAVHGPGGVGKSALAIHVAHKVSARFPDGQLYLDLYGSTPGLAPVDPADGLARLLRSLDGGSVPTSVDEASARYRTLTAKKRLLVVLDNAASAAQIDPFLPGGSKCAVLVTSRRYLTVAGSANIRLGPLPEREAVRLLARLIGRNRAESDRGDAAEIVRLCGRLPLAINVAGARLNARRTWQLRDLSSRLQRQEHRLDELQTADLAVRASFLASYAELPPDQSRMFRLLSLIDVPDVGTGVAAALAGLSEDEAEDLVDGLTDAQLVENTSLGRYRLHDLFRLFARERAAEEETPEQCAQAVLRVLHCHLSTARSARDQLQQGGAPTWPQAGPDDLCHPGLPLADRAEIAHWVDTEARNALRVAAQAMDLLEDGPSIVAGLTDALAVALELRSPREILSSLASLGLEAAERTGDRCLRARLLTDLAYAEPWQSRARAAADYLHEALDIWSDLDHPRGRARSEYILGMVYTQMNRHNAAIECYRRARDLYRTAGHRTGESAVLTKLGCLLNRLDRFSEASSLHEASLEISRDLDDPWGVGVALCNLGESLRLSGDLDRAEQHLREAIDAADEAGDHFTEAEAWWGLGEIRQAQGQHGEARHYWRNALTYLEGVRAISKKEAARILSAPVPETPDAIRSQR